MRVAMILAVWFITLISCPAAAKADGSFWLEPQIGFRSLSGDPGDILQAGPVVGGVLGYQITPLVALTGLVDVGFHSPDSDVSVLVSDGVTFTIAAGGRIYPLAKENPQGFQPFLGAGVGRAAMALSYDETAIAQLELITGEVLPTSEGFGSWVFSLEGGGDVHLSEKFLLGGCARYNLHTWDDQSSRGYPVNIDGNSFQLSARVGIRL